MPAIRPSRSSTAVAKESSGPVQMKFGIIAKGLNTPNAEVAEDLAICDMYYPTDAHSRRTFRTKEGKAVTPHQWAVYDFTRTIPCGRVTTYKDMCTALGEGSPRSVGTALRRNPFAPFVPCHRIVASDGSVGGFRGSWGVGKQKRDTKAPTKLLDAKGETIDNCKDKVSMLMREGVNFTPHGRLSDMNVIWRG